MSSTKELLRELNARRVLNGKPELASWKSGTAKLLAAIANEPKPGEAEAPQTEAGETGETQVAHEETFEAPADELAGQDGRPVDHAEPETGEAAASDLTSDVKIPRGAIGTMVIDLLQTETPYEDIVKQVKEAYPTAKTTARSIASVAMDLRRDGVTVPSRRKPAKEKPAKAPKPDKKGEEAKVEQAQTAPEPQVEEAVG